jgi:hypothetical protein
MSTDLLSDAKRQDAEKELNARLVRAGREPGSFTEDELLDAYANVTGSIASDVVRDVLLEHGVGPEKIVTKELLTARADEILREQGFYEVVSGGGRVQPARDDEVSAFRAAVEQLGLPGKERKDLATITASARDTLIDDAIADGVLTAELGEVYRGQYDAHPELTVKTIAAFRDDVRVKAFAGKEELPLNGEAFELHTLAENMLLDAGTATGRDQHGALVFAADVDGYGEYATALDRVTARQKAEREAAEEAAA